VKQETIEKAISNMYPNLKVVGEPGKVLVWASPEEHVKIGETVEEANKEVDPESELAEKFVAHSTANIDPTVITQLQELFKAMIPDADVHADPTANKIVVRARARDHQRINELFEQLREKDERLRPQLVVYPFGDVDPVMVEAMLRNQLPNARSMSPQDLVWRLGYSFYYEDMGYTYDAQGRFVRIPPKRVGYYKVDPQARVVHVFVTGELQKEVGAAMEQLFAAGNQEGIKLVVKRYSMAEIDDFYDVRQLIQRIAANALIQPIYERVPSTYTYSYGGVTYTFSDYYWRTTGDFLAYTTEGEHDKIEGLMRQLSDQAGVSKKQLLTIAIPEQSPYSKEKVVEIIQRMHSDISPMTGGTVNQILVWAPKHRLEQIQKMVDEVCQPLPEGERTITKSYPLRFISVESATAWLSALYPNAAFNPEKLATSAPGAEPRPAQDFERADKGKFVVVVATPLEQAEIEKTIGELDQDLPDAIKKVPRAYTLDEMPAHMFWSFFHSLYSTFTNAVCTPFAEQMTAVVVATEDEHVKVAEFVKNYREDIDRKRPILAVYTMKRLNYHMIAGLINRMAPTAWVNRGSEPEQIAIFGTPHEQAVIAEALAKLETSASLTPNQRWQVYKTGTRKRDIATGILYHQFPGILTFPINESEIFVWASPADHEAITNALKSVAEAFPDPTMRVYSFKHVPLHEGAEILHQAFVGQVTSMTPRPSTDDLMVYAAPDIHEKIAASIANFDLPRPDGTEALPKVYDLSDIPHPSFYPQWIMWTVVPQIREALQGRIQVVQGVSPGQIVVWAKPADHEKVDSMIKQMLAERPSATSETRVYTLQRNTNVANVQLALPFLAPNAQHAPGGNQNQLVVWAREMDHRKIQAMVDTLNEADPNIVMELHSIKNINYMTAWRTISYVVTGQGLDVRWFPDYVGYQYIVLASPENQRLIAEILDRIRAEDRELLPVALEVVDPLTAQMAINRLFYDDSPAEKPTVEIDLHTNYLFVQGVPKQLERVAKLLRDMGENVWYPAKPPEAERRSGGTFPGNIRTIQIRGGADTLRELEKLWNQTQPNPLRVIKDAETPAQYSLEDEIQRGTPQNEPETERSAVPGEPESSPVYIVADESGTLTITSADTAALDRLELLLDRLNSGIVYEGRDYTIFSVRNISVSVVYGRLQVVLKDKLFPQRQMQMQLGTERPAMLPLVIEQDLPANTLIVRGSKSDRMEVGKLIALFDVSELPGEQIVRKPKTVLIENTEASKVRNEVLKVFQAKLRLTQLPGGISPDIIANATTNSLEIFAPEPLLTQLEEYAKEVDAKALVEPGRKLTVIQLGVKARVVQEAINQVRMTGYGMQSYPYGMPYNYYNMYNTPYYSPYNNPWRGGMRW
jgi:type II secretory pathway component GspD/PulD (secretin)